MGHSSRFVNAESDTDNPPSVTVEGWTIAVLPAPHRLLVDGVEVGDVLDHDDHTYAITTDMRLAEAVRRAFEAGRRSTRRPRKGVTTVTRDAK